jgi:hypothetical protein
MNKGKQINLHDPSIELGEDFSELEREAAEREAAWRALRLTKFTASEAHRLMAGAELSNEDRAYAHLSTLKLPDLQFAADEHEVPTKKPGRGDKEVNRTMAELIGDLAPKMAFWFPDKLPEGALTYVEEKVVETKTGKPISDIETYDMRRGKEMEPEQVQAVMQATGLEIRNWGDNQVFREDVKNEKLRGHVGSTPDGDFTYKDIEFGFEGKCPRATTHHRYLYGSIKGEEDQPPLTAETFKEVEYGYYVQILKGFLTTDFAGWLWVSFCPDYRDEAERLLMIVIWREDVEEDIAHLERRLEMAVDEKLKRLEAKRERVDILKEMER